MRAALLLVAVAVAVAVAMLGCGDNDAFIPVDAAPGALTACLDRPADLLRPPTGLLPCELVPPGLTITP